MNGTTHFSRARKRLAWIVGRVLAGEHLNGEADRLDGDAREAVKAAMALPIEGRQKRIDAWLGSLDPEDANQIRRGVLACDPRGQDPDAVASVADLADLLGQIEWAWENWLPIGFVTLLVAEQENGKSLVALWAIVKSFLTRAAWPDGTFPDVEPNATAMWCEAESAHQMLLERCGKAGLPVARIKFPTADPFATIKLDNPGDVADLREAVRIHKTKILIYDALSGGHDKRENSSDEMLPVVRVLSDLARDFQICVLLIHHTSKAVENGEISLRSVRGASGITQLCRMVWALEKLDDCGWLRLKVIKSNIGKKPEPIGVRIRDNGLQFGEAPRPKRAETALDAAKAFLQKVLCDGRRKASELEVEADDSGIAGRTLKRAKSDLKIKSDKEGFGEAAIWWWSLPTEEGGQMADPNTNSDDTLCEL